MPKPKVIKKGKGSITNRKVPKEHNLNEKEKNIGLIMVQLKNKYVCNTRNHKHCFIKDDHHLQLSNLAFSIWACKIVSYLLFK